MLVLTRGPGEWVDVDIPPSDVPQRISVGVTRVEEGKTSLGFEAAPQIVIYRRELAESFKNPRPRKPRATNTP